MSGSDGGASSASATAPLFPTLLPILEYIKSWNNSMLRGLSFPDDKAPQSQLKGDSNWAMWYAKVQTCWEVVKLCNIVSGVHPHPTATDVEVLSTWETMDSSAKVILYSAVSPHMVTGLLWMNDVKDMWAALQVQYGGIGVGSLLNNIQHLTTPYDATLSTMEECTATYSGVVTEIQQAGFLIPNFFAAGILLSTLPYDPDCCDTYATFVEIQHLTSEARFNTVIGAANNHFWVKKSKPGNASDTEAQAYATIEQAFFSMNKYFCVNCKEGHTKDHCRQLGGGSYQPPKKKKGG
jgi:hypothetical protein